MDGQAYYTMQPQREEEKRVRDRNWLKTNLMVDKTTKIAAVCWCASVVRRRYRAVVNKEAKCIIGKSIQHCHYRELLFYQLRSCVHFLLVTCYCRNRIRFGELFNTRTHTNAKCIQMQTERFLELTRDRTDILLLLLTWFEAHQPLPGLAEEYCTERTIWPQRWDSRTASCLRVYVGGSNPRSNLLTRHTRTLTG